jgi:nitrogen fixation protein FixH
MKFVFLLAFVLSVSASAQTGVATLTLTTKPSPLGLGQNLFEVSVKDARGQGVTDATVTLVMVMPADPNTKHPEMRTEGTLNNVGRGTYNGVAIVTMAGDWDVTVTARRGGKSIGEKKARLTAYAKAPSKAPAPKK